MSSREPWSFRLILKVALTVLPLLSVGCGGEEPAPQGLSVKEPSATREATRCGVIELRAPDGSVIEQPEYYYFSAIDEKLAASDELRESVGLSSVSDCSSARHFMAQYREFLERNPDYPTSDPDPNLDSVDVRPSSEDTPEQTTAKIQAAPLSANPAVILLQFPNTGILCSGIQIGVYGLMSAAHCMGEVDGWQFMFVGRTLPNGALSFIRNEPIWVFWTHHASWGGPGDPVDDVAVGTIWNAYPVSTLPNPISTGTRIWLGSLGTGGSPTLVGYGASDIFGGGVGAQRTGAQTTSAVGTGHIDTLVPPGFVTVGCHGDSGGPLFGLSAGFQVALGLYTEFSPDNGLACPATSATQTFARLRTKITFIESLIGRCQRFSGGTTGNYARCW